MRGGSQRYHDIAVVQEFTGPLRETQGHLDLTSAHAVWEGKGGATREDKGGEGPESVKRDHRTQSLRVWKEIFYRA